MPEFIPEAAIGPIITGIFGLLIGLVAAFMARRGQKLGNRETRAPDVQEMWAQQEGDRRMRQLVEDIWWTLRRAFQSYYRRVNAEVAKMGLTEAQAKRFELTASERKAIETGLPEEK